MREILDQCKFLYILYDGSPYENKYYENDDIIIDTC